MTEKERVAAVLVDWIYIDEADPKVQSAMVGLATLIATTPGLGIPVAEVKIRYRPPASLPPGQSHISRGTAHMQVRFNDNPPPSPRVQGDVWNRLMTQGPQFLDGTPIGRTR